MSRFKDTSGGGGLDGTPGFMIRSPGAPHRTQLANKDADTQLRIWPAPRNDGSGFMPMRESADPDMFGLAVWVEPVVVMMGVHERFTYITRIPGDQRESPTVKFCKTMIESLDKHPHDFPREWVDPSWIKGSNNQGARLDKVKNVVFFQGETHMIKGKPQVDDNGRLAPMAPTLFMGKTSLLISFQKKGNKRAEGYTGPDPTSIKDDGTEASRQRLDQMYASMFELGDWCSVEAGRLMRVFFVPSSGDGFAKYDLELLAPTPLTVNPAGNFWPWEKLLRYHTAEEQIGYLCRAFPVEAVDYALSRTEYEGLLPPHVKGTFKQMQDKQTPWGHGANPQAAAQMGMSPAGAPSPAAPPTGAVGAAPPPGGYTAPYVPPAAAPAAMPPAAAPAAMPPAAASAAAPPVAAPVAPMALPSAPAAPPAPAGVTERPSMAPPTAPAENTAPPQNMMGQGGYTAPSAEFSGAPQGGQGVPQGASPGTPPAAAAGGAVDPAALATTLAKMNEGRDSAGDGSAG